jgi:hypothetical protein
MNHIQRFFTSGAIAVVAAVATMGASPPEAKEPAASGTGHEHHEHQSSDRASTVVLKKDAPQKGLVTTIVGEVMDPACFLEAGVKSIGPGHFQCAVDCARSGQTLAIYDRVNDRIYFIAGELPGKNPNDPLMAFIHKKVDVAGTVYQRAGAYGIVIRNVTLHRDGAASPTSASAPKGGVK